MPLGFYIFLNHFPVQNWSCASRPGVLLSSSQPLSKEHAHGGVGRPRGSENCTSIKNLFKYLPSQKREFRTTWPHPLQQQMHCSLKKMLRATKIKQWWSRNWGSPFLMIGWSVSKGKQMWRGDNCLKFWVRRAGVYGKLLKSYLLFSSRRAADNMQFGKMQHKLAKPCNTAPWHEGVMSSDRAESVFSGTVWKVTRINVTSVWHGWNALYQHKRSK